MRAGTGLRRLPKVELHNHLEGSLSRATLAALAARHRLPPPAPGPFQDLRGFLKSFAAVCDLLRDARDFDMAAGALFDASRRIGVAHLEVLFSPQVFLRRGIAPRAMMEGLLSARRRATARPGFSAVYIMDGVRQWGGEWFEETLRLMAPWAGRGVAGAGVGGDEIAAPAHEFRRAFRLARSLGLRTTIHAGEAAGPEAVREALDTLRPDRIGHGVAAARDAALVRRLATRGIVLEVCPSSNVATGAAPSWREHPLRALFDAGVAVTLNTDDGAFFHTDLLAEMRRAAGVHHFSRRELGLMMIRAARAAFLPEGQRRVLERRLAAAWGRAAPALREERGRAAAGRAS